MFPVLSVKAEQDKWLEENCEDIFDVTPEEMEEIKKITAQENYADLNSSEDSAFVCEEKVCKFENGKKKEGDLTSTKSHPRSDLNMELCKSENKIDKSYINNYITTSNKYKDVNNNIYNNIKKKSVSVDVTTSKITVQKVSADLKPVYDKLRGIGLVEKKCNQLLCQHDAGTLNRALEALYRTLSYNKGIHNPAGYFLYMLDNMDFSAPQMDSTQATEVIVEDKKAVLKKLGFSDIFCQLLVGCVQKGERFTFTDTQACKSLGYDPESIYQYIRTSDATYLPSGIMA